jgi:hypothetical protein
MEETNMNEALSKYLEAIKEDYRKWNGSNPTPIQSEMTKEFEAGLVVEEGSVYLKVISNKGSSRSVHSFIVKEDGPKFKRGDILKAASWNAPAKNQARGNIFGAYRIRWTGAEYLR